MPGFDAQDPMADKNVGYRIDALRSGIASYNGYYFPPALRSQVTVVPEYNDAGTSLKYITFALSIEFILTDPDREAYEIGLTDDDNHDYVHTMVRRLTAPCQGLEFSASGWGNLKVNMPGGIKDVDFGPKPQVIEWEPLGQHAARVQWLCVTRIPHDISVPIGSLIQYQYSSSWALDPSGFMLRTIEGKAEIPRTRNSTNGEHADTVIAFPESEFKVVQEKVLKAFPMLGWMRRQVFWRWENNRKTLSFKIEDTELRGGNPLFPGTSDIEINQNISSDIENGFLTWRLTYTGRIECVNGDSNKGPGINSSKALAWLWLGKYLQDKRKKFEQRVRVSSPPGNKGSDISNRIQNNLPGFPIGPAVSLDDIYDTEKVEEFNLGAMIYPVHVSITDSLYSNSFQFTFGYVAIVTTDILVHATGLFEPIQLEGLDYSTAVRYIAATDAHKGNNISKYERAEMVVDLCTPLTGPESPSDSKKTEKPKKEKNPILSVTTPELGRDWLSYENNFYFYDQANNVIGQRLHGDTENTKEFFPPEQATLEYEMLNKPTQFAEQNPSASDTQSENKVQVYSPVKHTVYVRMKGHAARFGGRVNSPVLLGIGGGITVNPETGEATITDHGQGGTLVHKYGVDKIQRKASRTGLSDTNGKPVTVHTCSWDKWYICDWAPTTGQLTTTGIPERFKTNF